MGTGGGGIRGVILAGGSGRRMAGPMRDQGVRNKHLLRVGGRPMVGHPLEKLTEAGVEEVLVVTSPEGVGPLGDLLRSGRTLLDPDRRITYRVQDRPAGIAQALSLAEDFARGGPVAVVLGDNLWHAPFPRAFLNPEGGRAWVARARVSDPERYGVATLDRATRRLAKIEEKPAAPESDLAVTGVYLYPSDVFDKIRSLAASERGELEITDLNNLYLAAGRLEYVTLPGWWVDAGTPEGLAEADRLCGEQPPLW